MKQATINIIHVREPNFLEYISKAIEKYPNTDIVNIKDSTDSNQTFLHKLSYTEFTSYVAYFLEKRANIYTLDNDKLNPLHSVVGRASLCIMDTKLKSTIASTYQIFRLLLNYEAEQRAYFPEKYQGVTWLKDQPDDVKWTPIARAQKLDKSPGKEVVEELKKALQEQEIYYQECLEAKAELWWKVVYEENIVGKKYYKD